MKSLKTSIIYINEKIEDFEGKLKIAENKINDMNIEKLQSRIQLLEIDAENKNRINNLKCLEFRGIPENREETPALLKSIIFNISKITNCSLVSKDIEEVYRITPREKTTRPNDNKPRTVLVKLNSPTEKEN